MLPDGRSLVTGGGSVALAAAEYFGRNGTTTAVAPMTNARRSHICVGLPDGTVLAAGGFGEGGDPTSSAELFHLDTDETPTSGPLPGICLRLEPALQRYGFKTGAS